LIPNTSLETLAARYPGSLEIRRNSVTIIFPAGWNTEEPNGHSGAKAIKKQVAFEALGPSV
jgi:hypothetical protein